MVMSPFTGKVWGVWLVHIPPITVSQNISSQFLQTSPVLSFFFKEALFRRCLQPAQVCRANDMATRFMPLCSLSRAILP